jgi:hypothetical protein
MDRKKYLVSRWAPKLGLAALLSLTLLVSTLVWAPVQVEASVSTYFRTITINGGQTASILTDFPVLINITADTNLKSSADGGHVANADGSDIYFTDPDGITRYSSEIESYSPGTGALAAWVKIPSLSTGTTFRLYYGGSSPARTASSVWSNAFQAVWHLNQGGAADSTVNANNGTAHGNSSPPAITIISGPIDGADNFTPGSTYFDCGNSSSLNFIATGSYTWEAWINPAEFHSGGSGIIGKEPGAGHDYVGYDLNLGGNGNGQPGTIPGQFRFQTTGGSALSGYPESMISSSSGMTLNTWTHVAVTYSYASRDDNYTYGAVSMYINGVLDSAAGGTVATHDDTSSHLCLGWKQNSNAQSSVYSHFKGGLDEIEYSSSARSADWILAQYRNQKTPAGFYTLGAEQMAPPLLNPDTTAITTIQPIDITFMDDPAWRAAVSEVSLDGVVLTGSQYTLSAGDLKMTAGVLNNRGAHTILVKAGGYADDAVIQQIVTRGDVNSDGNVNVLDVIMSVNFALGKTTPTAVQFSAADYNNDGLINVLDVIQMVNKALGR